MPDTSLLARRRGSAAVLAASCAGALLLLVAAVVAGFGWLDLLRDAGALGFGPRIADALPLRRLAGASDQPLARVLLAFGSVGLLAGFGLARRPRAGRFVLLLIGSLGLLALASEAAYAVAETESLGATLGKRHPGSGVLVEAALFAAAGAIPGRRRARPR